MPRRTVRDLLIVATMLAVGAIAAPAEGAVRLSPSVRATVRPAGLVLGYAVRKDLQIRSAKLRFGVAKGKPRLGAFRVRRIGKRYRRLSGAPIRGTRSGRRVTFDLTKRVRPGRRLLVLVAALNGRRWTVPRGRPKLVVRERPSTVVPDPTPVPDPSPTPVATPAPQLTASATPTAIADPTPNPTSAPTPPPTPTATLRAAGDIACAPSNANFNNGAGVPGACQQMATSDLLFAQRTDAVLALGDLQYESATQSEFDGSYIPSWGRQKPITRPAPGNHEYWTSGASGYFDYFNGTGNQTGPAGDRSEGWYSFDIGGWHVVALNSNCGSVAGGCTKNSPQEAWLAADLAAHPEACTLAFFHHARFSSDAAVGSNTSVAPLWDTLYAKGADVVLSGHAHDYERFAPQAPNGIADAAGIRQFVVGTGGEDFHTLRALLPNSEVFNSETFGVLRLDLFADRYSWQFEPTAGSTFTDSGTTTCH